MIDKKNGKNQAAMLSPALALFALLAIAGAAHASFEANFMNPYGESFENRLTNDWMPLAGIAVLVCILFNTLVYMVGFLFQSEQVKRYAKSEFMQVSASTLMIFFAVALLYNLTDSINNSPNDISVMSFMGQVIGTGDSSVACAASDNGGGASRFRLWEDSRFGAGPLGAFKCKIQEKITALDKTYNSVYKANLPVERLSSLCLSILGAPVYCWDWNLGLHQQVEEAHLIATKIVSLLMPLHAQFVLAEYIQKNMLSIFLPMGLVLRIFPLTRGVGGLFVAIAIAFFFVFPTFVVLTDPTFVKVEGTPPQDKQAGKCFTGFKGATVLLAGMDFGGATGESSLAVAQGADLVFELTIASIFYPFVAFVLSLIFIRAATPLLGGDTGEIMRMVSRLG